MSAATEKTYRVQGMTCTHCATSVREEVGRVPGVTKIEVDLDSGWLTVTGAGFTDEAVRAAVDEAGYGVVAS